MYTCGRFGPGFKRAVFLLSIECCQMPGVEEKCALSRRLWVVTVDTSMFKISKGARNGEERLAVGVVKHCKAPNACPWGWIKTDAWRRPRSWPCLTTSPPFCSSRQPSHAGRFLPDVNIYSSVHVGIISSASLPSRVINCRSQNLPERGPITKGCFD